MNWFKKPDPLTSEPVVVTTVKGDSVLYRMVTEADIRQEAYFLWEKNGKVGSSERYWYEAEQKIRKILLNQKNEQTTKQFS
jgi:hypothetical protein